MISVVGHDSFCLVPREGNRCFLSDQQLAIDSSRGAVVPGLTARTDSTSERRHLG